MSSKHTPGPWTLSDEDSPLVSDANGAYIAQVFSRTDADTGSLRDHYASDASLIGAAPDLLEALRLCKRLIDGGHGLYPGLHHEAYVAARNAIAKAEGEQT